MESLEERRVLAAYISEFHFDPLFGMTDTDQYLELRGDPNTALADGTYFIGIESADGVDELGDIHSILDLSGLTFGSNGMMVFLQSEGGFAVAPEATLFKGDSGTSTGFQGLPGGIFEADGGAQGIHAGSSTYLLVQSDVKPLLTDDIDSDDNGVPEGVYSNWQILDGFATLPWVESVWPQRTYAPITFSEDGVGDSSLPGSTFVVAEEQAYAGRIGQSIGYTPEEWLTGNTVENNADAFDFELQSKNTFGTTRPYAYGGRILDHVGSPNWFSSVEGLLFEDLNQDGQQQAGEAPVSGITVSAVPASGNGFFWEVIEPDMFSTGTIVSNISRHVSMVTAGADNKHVGFKTEVVQDFGAIPGQHIFSSSGVSFFSSSSRLRMDFYRDVRSIEIDVIGASNLSDTYGRLEIYDKDDNSLGWVRSQPLGDQQRETLRISSNNADIHYAVAYSDESLPNSTPFGSFDSLRVEVPTSSATTTADGRYVLSKLIDDSYDIVASETADLYQAYPANGDPHFVVLQGDQHATDVNFGFLRRTSPNVPDAVFNASESLAANAVVGQLDVMLAYPGQQLDFTIDGGDPLGQFEIDPSTFELKVKNGDLDFETTGTYSLSVTAVDISSNAYMDNATVDVTVLDVNEAPQIDMQEVTYEENQPLDFLIATMTGTDQDAGAAGQFTWSIAGGNPEEAFGIDPNSGEVRVANPVALSFEVNPVFSLIVRATDGGDPSAHADSILTVNLTDVDEAPIIDESPLEVRENSLPGALAGQLRVLEQDFGETITWALIDGDLFDFVVEASGDVRVAEGAELNFEQRADYSLVVEATDSASPPKSTTATIAMTLLDWNDPPVLPSQDLSIDENLMAGASVGFVDASDEDVDGAADAQTLTYSITGGEHASQFQIDSVTGELTVAAGAELDFEATPSLNLRVTVEDNWVPVASATNDVIVNLNNVNEAPSISDTQIGVEENSPAGTLLTVNVDDPDAGDSFQYEILSQSLAWLEVNAEGQLQVVEGANIDFEGQSEMELQVRVTDGGGLSGTSTVTVTAIDANDAPVVADGIPDLAVDAGEEFTFTVPETAFSDQDAGDTLTYAATDGNGFSLPSWLSFDPSTGTLTGTPTSDEVGILDVQIIARDSAGEVVTDAFQIDIQSSDPWHNPVTPEDTSSDGFITAIDALLVINYLNLVSDPVVPPNDAPDFGLIDVNADGFVTPIDALIVINNVNSGSGEGEAQASAIPWSWDDISYEDDDELLEQLALEQANSDARPL